MTKGFPRWIRRDTDTEQRLRSIANLIALLADDLSVLGESAADGERSDTARGAVTGEGVRESVARGQGLLQPR